MFRLALATVWFDRLRYSPIAVVVTVAGLMLMAQLAIAVGVFRDASSPVNRSTAVLWAGPEGSATLTDSRGLDAGRASVLWVIPELERLEPFATGFAQLSAKPSSGDDFSMDFESDGMRFVMLVYLNADETALLYARHIPADIRARLSEAGTIVIGQEDAEALGVKVGDKLWLENRPLRLVGTLPGLQGLGMSTALIGTAGQTVPGPPAFWLLGLKPGTTAARINEIADQLSSDLRLSILPSKTLSEATMFQFAFESGAGTIFMYSAGLAFVIAAMVVNQVMRAAVMGAMREYAALRAFGISFGRLVTLVLLQGGLIAAGSVTMMLGLTLVLLAFLRWSSVPYDLPPVLAAVVAVALVLVLCLSTLLALRNLRLADPTSLLR
jgi:putative ABC transport system permease protein